MYADVGVDRPAIQAITPPTAVRPMRARKIGLGRTFWFSVRVLTETKLPGAL
jgi:hypothetical protein